MINSNAHAVTDETLGPIPPYDPECVAALSAMAAAGVGVPKLTGFEDIPAQREWLAAATSMITHEALSRDGRFEVFERTVPGPEGAPEIILLVCRPVGTTAPMPVFYHIHGGGMIMGDRRGSMLEVLELAEAVGAAVVSVEYRLAPEHPAPAGVEDCYAGLVWTAEHAEELGVDSARLIIVGASAGGGLAAGTTLLARDRRSPALLGSLLMCPMLDDLNNSISAVQSRTVGTWTGVANGVAWTAVLGEAQGGPNVPYAVAPSRATDLSGLPPTFLDVGSAEMLRSETVAYAERIWSSGGVAELHVWPGGYHGYDTFAPQAPVSRATVEARIGWLRRLIATVD